MQYYFDELKNLTNEQLKILSDEIESSGVLACDLFDYPEDSWQYQASRRWSELIGEQYRREPPHPGTTSSSLKQINDVTLQVVEKLSKVFTMDDSIFRSLR